MHTTIKGDIAKWRVVAALVEQGEHVLLPVSENERYDVALDRAGSLYRIQCKSGRYRVGCVTFRACSSLAHWGGPVKDYVGQVEAFGVYCHDLKRVYIVPIERMRGTRSQYLRVDPLVGKGALAKKRLLAAEFEIRVAGSTGTAPLS